MYDFSFHIEQYPQLKAINTLRCYPFDFHEDQVTVAQKLKDRGERFYQLVTQSGSERMFIHKGNLIWTPNFANVPDEVAGFFILGNIMAEAVAPRKKEEWRDSASPPRGLKIELN